MQESCNICSNTTFVDYRGRKKIRCSVCKSLERHRLLRWTLEKLGYLGVNQRPSIRILHLAPEKVTHDYLVHFGGGYICSDLKPETYPYAKCLKLALPEGFVIFPDSYFDLILHNHVLEHIPGDYRDHLSSFIRLLNKKGHMVFTLPGVSKTTKTVQGGEHLASDAERTRIHGQYDHYKTFGNDFFEYFQNAPGRFTVMDIPLDARLSLRAPRDDIFVYSQEV